MMSFSIFIFLALLINALAQETTLKELTTPSSSSKTTTQEVPTTTIIELQDKNEYIVNFDYFIREEQMPTLVIDVILKESVIPVADIIKLLKLENITIDSYLVEMAAKLTSNFKFVDSLSMLLDLIGTDFDSIYSKLIKNLTHNQTMSIVKDLKIDELLFAYAYTFKQTDVFEVLQTGNFSEENVAYTLNKANITAEELFDSVKIIIIEELKEMSSEKFHDIVRQTGINDEVMLALWNEARITTEDVYNIQSIRDYLSALVITWENKNFIGVAVGDNSILVHNENYEELKAHNILKQFRVVARSLTNIEARSEVVRYKSLKTNTIAEMQVSEFIGDKIEIGYKYKQLDNCIYYATVDYLIIPFNVEIENDSSSIEISKSAQILFQKGAPLICRNKLYGMANENKNNTIAFSAFYAPNEPSESILSKSITMQDNMLYSVFLFSIVFHYL